MGQRAYADDESGFYQILNRVPASYRSNNRQEMKSSWPAITSVAPGSFFGSSFLVILAIPLLVLVFGDHTLWFPNLLGYIVASFLMAWIPTAIFLLIGYVRMVIFKSSHKNDFGNISIIDLWRANILVAKRVESKEKKWFPVPPHLTVDSVSNRPDFYNQLPSALRSRSRYELKKTWGKSVFFNENVVLPYIFLFGFLLFLSNPALLPGALFSIFAWVLLYKIFEIAFVGRLSSKYFGGKLNKEVKAILKETRKFVNSVDPGIVQRMIISIKSPSTQLQPLAPAPLPTGNSVMDQSINQPSMPSHTPVSRPFRNGIFGFRNKASMVTIDPNSNIPVSSQYLSQIIEYEKKLGLR